MGAATNIAWTNATFNCWWGCQRVSPGCEKCYAETFSKRVGLKVWGPTTERRFFGDKHWAEPVKWNEAARKAGERRRVFCASMADVFEDREDLIPHRDRLFALIDATPNLDWQILTKRPQNILAMRPRRWFELFPKNVWIGTTAEDQKRYDERWAALAVIPCGIRFMSLEPLLGPIELKCHGCGGDVAGHRAGDHGGCDGWFPDWVIVGGESGPGARPFDLRWGRDLVRQCAGVVPLFFKQLGSNPLMGGPSDHVWFKGSDSTSLLRGRTLADRKGGDIEEFPTDLRVRQFPEPLP